MRRLAHRCISGNKLKKLPEFYTAAVGGGGEGGGERGVVSSSLFGSCTTTCCDGLPWSKITTKQRNLTLTC
jgi:hypothetical protein